MDVVDLKEFYQSPIGQTARRMIAHRIMARWGKLSGANVLGLGYAVPYLEAWRGGAERLIAFMPARQGVMHWPSGRPSSAALVDEVDLPLDDGSMDLVLVIHGLELTDHLPDMLSEIWRILSPQGRALFVVPNRRGMWARFDTTPFGHGRPFSRQQLSRILRDAQFTPSSWAHALFMPPINRRPVHRSAVALERAGLWVSPGFSGVIMVEAIKQVYAIPSTRRSRELVPQLKPQILPAPARDVHSES
jgi:SAM-dependent methyltransferase